MSTVNTAPPATALGRTVAIDFLFLDMATCRRCQGTGANLESALASVEGALRATGAWVELRRIHVQSAEQARELELVSSPTIRVNGRDIALERLESECGADGCSCGAGASCRVWQYAGREHTEAPVGLIVDAILSALYAGPPRPDPAVAPYELPDNLARVFAAEEPGAPGGGCCA